MKIIRLLLISFCFFYNTNGIAQPKEVSISITNAENKTTTFSLAELSKLPQMNLTIKGEDEVTHAYSGVDIHLLLNKANVQQGMQARKETLKSYVVIKAIDGYSVLYAMAELDTLFSDKKMILALLKDGHPLPEKFGPLQIIATGEKKHARLIRQVSSFMIKKDM